jgi:surfactin synthase thioesterase subunit/3-oxoacyl-(acyl-carrier-protein) synthase/acyl carrier protein
MAEVTPLHKALITIQKLKRMLKEQQMGHADDIAIVGLSCRFPQANNKEEFWQLLSQGKNVISKLPEERWHLLKDTEEAGLRDPSHPYWGGYLSHIEKFDAYFFGISTREALLMDPQQRLLLEVAYEAFEDAGFSLETLKGSNTGVFSSLYANQYGHWQQLENELDALYIPTGNAISIAANRLSYIFDLNGPSLVLDTACSSSLVATQLAVLNLQNKVCDTALVCGVNINLLPSTNLLLAKAKMLSPDGQCKTFDASANGYVQGEGVGVVILKRLSKAVADKDRIYAVIKGVNINQDGKTNGLTAPNGLQQEKLLQSIYQSANIQPEEISYVECHGTGTFLGDPIEVQALGKVLGKNRNENSPCFLGSVKSNIGHLEPAAGVASLIKVALVLREKKIPKQLNYIEPNPHIPFNKYQFSIPDNLLDFPKYNEARMAGISGFGFGGTNSHVLLSEYDSFNEVPVADARNEIFTLSAKSPQALQVLIERWCDFLKNNTTINFSALCYNTHLRRSHFPIRLAIIAQSLSQLLSELIVLSSKLTNKNSYPSFVNLEIIPEVNDSFLIHPEIDLETLAQAYIKNTPIDWQKFEENRSFQHIDMPTYGWHHKVYWPNFKNKPDVNSHALKGKSLSSPLAIQQFEFTLDTKSLPELLDTYHIAHAGYYFEMLCYALNNLHIELKFTIHDLHFISAAIIPHDTKVMFHLLLTKVDESHYDFSFFSRNNKDSIWIENAKGNISVTEIELNQIEAISKIKDRCKHSSTSDDLYQRILAMGMPAGDTIRWTKQYWQGIDEILCELQEPLVCQTTKIFYLGLHPGIIDACIQPVFGLLPDTCTQPYMASTFNKINFHAIQKNALYLYIKLHEITADNKIVATYYLMTADNKILIEFQNAILTQLDKKIDIAQLLQDKSDIFSEISHHAITERKHLLTQHLIHKVAHIFSTPEKDINENQKITDLGLDSLMGLVLLKALESSFKLSYDMQDLLNGPTISDLVDLIMSNNKLKENPIASSSLPSTPWLSYKEKRINPKIRVFCFPYGGGSASIYRDWHHDFPETIEVCPIQLPGRENRLNEMPISEMKGLIKTLISELRPYLNVPFLFFGHSMGALIAYELTRELKKQNLPLPMHLFVSAFPDPRLPAKGLNNLLTHLNKNNITLNSMDSGVAISKLSDEQLLILSDAFNQHGLTDYKDYLLNREITKILLPIFINDMKLIKDYRYQHVNPLDIPLTVFLSKCDAWIPYDDHLSWQEHTSKSCTFHEYDAEHLFIKDKSIKQAIINIIVSTLNAESMVANAL